MSAGFIFGILCGVMCSVFVLVYLRSEHFQNFLDRRYPFQAVLMNSNHDAVSGFYGKKAETQIIVKRFRTQVERNDYISRSGYTILDESNRPIARAIRNT